MGYGIMIVCIVGGAVMGMAIGYLLGGRKVTALMAQQQANEEREQLLRKSYEELLEHEKVANSTLLKEKEQTLNERLAAQEKSFNERLNEQQSQWEARVNEQQSQWEARLKQQKEEAEALHKRMNIEFENLSNRIFQSKTEDFTKLNAEQINNLLKPLSEKIKDFHEKVEQVYSTESKERFSLGERIK